MNVKLSQKVAIAQRRQQVAELTLDGWTQSAIAAQLGLTQAAISKDLKQIRLAWRESSIRDFDELRSQELAKLDRIEREAWAAWRRSQEPAQTATVDGTAGSQKAKRTVRHQYGDPRFLQVTLDAIEARRQMLGLDAPTKVAPTTPDGQPLTNEQRSVLIEALLDERLGPVILDTTREEPVHESQPPATSPSPGKPDGRGTGEA
jgi:hypothetical protein